MIYIECVRCGCARATDNQDSADDWESRHRKATGHTNYYVGDPPADRAAQLRGSELREAMRRLSIDLSELEDDDD